MYQTIENVRVWGTPLENAVSQAITCAQHGQVVQVLLMADHHKGYSQPVGGVVVYDGQISPSGVGYDTRKGATPSAPGQLGFIGGSMGDYSVIVRGKDSQENKEAFYSTVHGAGRIMSRTEAAGRMNWKTKRRSGGKISMEQMRHAIREFGVVLRGAGVDESPFVYKKLSEVLKAHEETLEILHVLKPIGVCMAGADEFDPYKD
ncbi:RtcB family protein [Brevibacillus composti]|uniref:3'-phosphate/5'-hydroxy nucleic acid ligase n=1 Tax=Brevibacillus composti TaxID=2796470 RepID=A0A7T5JMV6_9BACL|nr:RtcB family protein [Brevibacillus composti]QQE73487.1 RtcB family protein [Brevibacillus composti]QUO40569.1 RtcB family protein [Brevibacillus composti]